MSGTVHASKTTKITRASEREREPAKLPRSQPAKEIKRAPSQTEQHEKSGGDWALGQVRKDRAALKIGAKGEAVSELQKLLNARLEGKLPLTGTFGPQTERAVRDFQKAHGLETDGVVGAKTLKLLELSPHTSRRFTNQVADFKDALAFVLKAEGGLSRDQNDSANRGGKATNFGITQETYDTWRTENRLPRRSVIGIKNSEVVSIYKEMYWREACCDRLPAALAMVHFDTAVNMGPEAAARLLQRTLGIAVTGKMDQATFKALHGKDPLEVLKIYFKKRKGEYERIAGQGSNERFLDGWMNRMKALWARLG